MAETSTQLLKIPDELKPADGRFGSGPSRVRPEQLQNLAGPGAAVMSAPGTCELVPAGPGPGGPPGATPVWRKACA